jgi:NitT/TauT family transport system substrate-binding protein
MKKILIVTLCLALVFSFASCVTSDTTPKQTLAPSKEEPTPAPTQQVAKQPIEPIRIATLAGPTGMGLVNLVNDDTGKYDIEVLTQPDQLAPKIINGEVNVATIPSNLAAVLYAKMQGGISVVAVNTKGVLYLVGNNAEITSLKDVEGKEVYLTGQGATPEYIVNDLLAKNDIDTNLTFMSAHADLANAMASGDVTLGILPEPFVSIALAQNKDLKVLADLNNEWQSVYGDGVEMPMGVTIVNNAFLAENSASFEVFLSDYAASVDYVNSDIEAAAADIVKAGIFAKEPIVKLAIPRSGIAFDTGEKAKNMLSEYFEVLFQSNPKSIGGSLPGEEFYY